MNVNNFITFKNVVEKIFNDEAGYFVEHNSTYNDTGFDFLAEMDENIFGVEVKYSQISDNAINQILYCKQIAEIKPVLVTAYCIEDEKRKNYESKHPNLILLDISNLLFAVKYNTELRNELVASLPYTVDNIEPKENFLISDRIQHNDYTKSLIEEMYLCRTGAKLSRDYEILCCKLLENIFSDDLALWRKQQTSNKRLYRFDLLCRIKDGNQKTFWSILERYFNSKCCF